MPYVEVDQSGKIEQFDKDTVIALSNDKNYSVLFPKQIKQEVFTEYKRNVNDLKYKLFPISLFYCIRNFVGEDIKTVICSEYERKESIIKSFLVGLLRDDKRLYYPNLIRFNIITKQSPAHQLAISVFRKEKRPNLLLSKNHIYKLLR